MSDASGIEIREALPADAPTLLRMMRTLAEQEPGKIEFDEAAVEAALRAFLEQPELGCMWLLWDRETPVGYVALTLSFSFEYRGRDAFIDELFIEPAYRRRGLGRMAMEFAETKNSESTRYTWKWITGTIRQWSCTGASATPIMTGT